MNIYIIREKIDRIKLDKISEENFGRGEMIKGVVDIKRGVIALGGELHADAEEKLLEDGSHQDDLWGFNIYPQKPEQDWIEYTSFINIRPEQNNRSMEVEDENLQKTIRRIVTQLVERS